MSHRTHEDFSHDTVFLSFDIHGGLVGFLNGKGREEVGQLENRDTSCPLATTTPPFVHGFGQKSPRLKPQPTEVDGGAPETFFDREFGH